MDSGITSDQNFYSRSAPLQSFGDDDHGHGDIFTMLSDRSKTPLQLSNLDFVATNNVHATTANGYAIDRTASHEDSPDDFYKGYHSHTYNANESGHGNLSNGTAGSDLAHNVPSSLRSNGNGTTPKYPAITGLRTATRPSYRSASAPIDERLSSGSAKCTPTLKGVPKSQQPSVKDLRQRFDPNGNQPSSLPRRPPSQVRNNSPDVTGRYKPTVLAENRQSGTKPGQATREPYKGRVKSPAPPRVAQRGRFATEDHHSNNTLASATRSTKPRNRVSGNVDGSQSMMNLAASSSLAKPIPTDAARKPLFGEIVPAESGSQIAYGISDSRGRARQTSDSGLLPQSSSRRRSYSDLDVSPTSPTAWYLGVTPKLDDVDIQTTPKPTKNHSRSQSDVGGRSIPNGISAMAELEAFKPAEQIQPKAPSRSRLPVSSKRASISSTSSSPGSTRATSPFIAKMNASINSKLRNPESRPWSPPGHGTTSGRGSSRGHARSPGQVVTSNASLKAYISSPPPMKSPPLRSSRPRLPVSAATTASSRSKMADNAKLAQSRNNITRAESGAQEQERIKRLEFAGPVDYAAKRAWIQQSISKNIQETKQRELEQIEQRELDEARQREEANPQPSEADLQHIGDSAAEPKLVIDTSFLSPSNSLPIQHPNLESTDSDSPTLGLSGSFPKSEFNDDDIPLSAISTVTAVTIFDNELQTEPPRHHSVADIPLVILSSQSGPAPQDAESIPGDFGAVQDGDGSIRIVLDAVSSEEPRFESHRHDHHDLADNEGPMYNSMDGESHPTFTDTEFSSSEPEAESASFIRPPSPDSAFDSQRIAYDSHFEDAGTLPQSNRYSSIQQRSSVSVSDNGMPAETVPTDPVSAWSPRHVLPNHPPASHLPKIDTSLSVSYTAEALAPSDSGSTPVTEIDYDSSEGVDAALDTAYEDNSLTEASTQQTVPQTDSQSWPNFTVEGNNPSSWHENSHRISTSFHEPLGAPPPPPKEPLSSQKPEVPPKPASYIPRLSPRSHGDFSIGQDSDRFSELDSSMTDSNEMNPTSTSSPNSSAIPPIPAPPSWLSEAVSQPTSQSQVDTISSKSGRTPPPSNVWNRHPPPSLHRYSFKDPDSRRGSGEQLYPYRPSTSTARSSGQISLEGDVAETPLSSNDQFSMEASQPNDDGSISETAVATLRHRRMLIQELIDTEAVYLKDMNVVVEIYQGTAEACPKLSVADIKTIFRNSDDVISFSENFLADIKASSTSIYIPRSSKSKRARAARSPESPDKTERPLSTADEESDWTKDQKTTIGANFGRHIEEMEHVYSDFLKNSEQATNRLQALQTDPTVKVWLEECNAVAKDLSGAWDLDALLVKPVQRITRYQLLLTGIVKHTPQDHPDYTLLKKALDDIKVLLDNIDGQKKRIHKVNEIVGGRKRKDSDLRVGLKNPFTRREKVETAVVHNRANEDQVYLKHCDRFHTECMHLQLIVRDVNRYIEYVTNWVEDFLRYLSAIELVVRASPSSYPELESKWARFNLSMRDMGKIALEQHKSAIRKGVQEPFNQLLEAYTPPQTTLKKRNKRRPDFEKFQYLKNQNRKIDDKLAEQVEQYNALNDTLKLELPKLSALNVKLKDMCLGRLITIQAGWYSIWNEKLRTVLEQNELPKDIEDILDKFSRDFRIQDAKAQSMSILNGTLVTSTRGRLSQSTMKEATKDDNVSMKSKSRTSTANDRVRGISVHSDHHSSLLSADPGQKGSGQFHFSPSANTSGLSLPQLNLREVSPTIGNFYGVTDSSSTPGTPAWNQGYRSGLDTRLSLESGGVPRPSADSVNSGRSLIDPAYNPGRWVDGLPPAEPSFSDAFNSALPWSNSNDESRYDDRRSSESRSDHRGFSSGNNYNVLYVVASLNEFNIEGTKIEAKYPYLTYQEGEIFDVIAEKGELWLAKNQDDPKGTVGWIWNQHFARMVEY